MLDSKFFKPKRRGYFIKKLKIIKFKKDIFCYLSFLIQLSNVKSLNNLDF